MYTYAVPTVLWAQFKALGFYYSEQGAFYFRLAHILSGETDDEERNTC